jgi:hypothetical protein
VLCHGTGGTGLIDSAPSFVTAGSSDLSIVFRCFKAISIEAVRFPAFPARLLLHQVCVCVCRSASFLFYVKSHPFLGIYIFHFVFECSNAVSVSEDSAVYPSLLSVRHLMCSLYLVLNDRMTENRSGGPEEANNETST